MTPRRWPARLRRRPAPDPVPVPLTDAPKPERPLYAIGDIHGESAMLDRLLAKIARQPDYAEAQLVFLGDYVDRGRDSKGVLQRLFKLQTARPERVECLLGNHDQLMIDFLSGGRRKLSSWLAVGGQETLISLGALDHGVGPDRGARLIEDLRAALGEELLTWLGARPLWWASGNVVAVHAHTDPHKPMEAQRPRTLQWGRPGETMVPREDGRWVVHGHTIVPSPTVEGRHINVDTGACRGGDLTAVHLDGDSIRFLSVQ